MRAIYYPVLYQTIMDYIIIHFGVFGILVVQFTINYPIMYIY